MFPHTTAVSKQWYEKLVPKFPKALEDVYLAELVGAECSL
jgi:hypothetical protein